MTLGLEKKKDMKEEIKDFLRTNPGYIKKSVERISQRTNCDINLCKEALSEVKQELKNQNINQISEFDKHLEDNNIHPDDVISVKYWQTASGKQRFSIVTKNEQNSIQDIKEEIQNFAELHSTNVPTVLRSFDIFKPIAYEISLPDLHYGKMHSKTLNEIESEFLQVIHELVDKASNLDIEKFILPIGNDGMNSEGLRQTTTKGTPQQDSAGWKDTFRGYWNLIVRAIDYLKEIAPVDVIVISGNHDYERMFYVGDVLAGWYRNDENVVIDNLESSRKYVEYGVNMIMFTHGDKEKPNDIPLIMATEQPEMFARTLHREAHCGHFHKEMLNEYRGVKVRFIPSICPNDEWHKLMGYEAKRTGQAFIWDKKNGFYGYLQTNL
jgi:hypothetical protein